MRQSDGNLSAPYYNTGVIITRSCGAAFRVAGGGFCEGRRRITGLKTIGYGTWGSGKTWFALSMAEVGPIGYIDTENRLEWYTEAAPAPVLALPFPFDRPRKIRTNVNPFLAAARGTVYVVQTKEVGVAGQAIETFTRDKSIVGIVIDSGSVLWDLLQDTRDDSDPRTAMLSWTPVKKTNRRLMYAATAGDKHLLISAHVQEKYSKAGRELVVTGTKPWLEKKTPHWADLVLEFAFPDGCPHPVLRVEKEGVGGQGGIVRGAILGDPTKGEASVSFASLLKRLAYVPTPIATEPSPDEIDYRNQTTVASVGGRPNVPEVDGEGR